MKKSENEKRRKREKRNKKTKRNEKEEKREEIFFSSRREKNTKNCVIRFVFSRFLLEKEEGKIA